MFHPQQIYSFYTCSIPIVSCFCRADSHLDPATTQSRLGRHGRRRLNLFANLVPDLEAIKSLHAPPLASTLGVPCPCPCKIPAPILINFVLFYKHTPTPLESQRFGPGFPPALVRRRTRAKRDGVKVQG